MQRWVTSANIVGSLSNSANGAFFYFLAFRYTVRHWPLIRKYKVYNSDKAKYIPADIFFVIEASRLLFLSDERETFSAVCLIISGS